MIYPAVPGGIGGGDAHGPEDRHTGWLQPDVPGVSRAANADDRAGRHAHQRGARLRDDGAEGDRGGAAGQPGRGLRPPRAHLPPQVVRRLQGHPQAHARRAAGPGPGDPGADRPDGHSDPGEGGLRGRRHPGHGGQILRGARRRGAAGDRRPGLLPALRPPHHHFVHQEGHHRHRAGDPGVYPRDLRPGAGAADRREEPDGRRLRQHPRRARRGGKDGPAPGAAVRQPPGHAGSGRDRGEGQAAGAPDGRPGAGRAELHPGEDRPERPHRREPGGLEAGQHRRGAAEAAPAAHERGGPSADGRGAGGHAPGVGGGRRAAGGGPAGHRGVRGTGSPGRAYSGVVEDREVGLPAPGRGLHPGHRLGPAVHGHGRRFAVPGHQRRGGTGSRPAAAGKGLPEGPVRPEIPARGPGQGEGGHHGRDAGGLCPEPPAPRLRRGIPVPAGGGRGLCEAPGHGPAQTGALAGRAASPE